MIDSQGFLKCDGCGKKLGSGLTGQVAIVCVRCKRYNVFDLATSLDKIQKSAILKVR